MGGVQRLSDRRTAPAVAVVLHTVKHKACIMLADLQLVLTGLLILLLRIVDEGLGVELARALNG